MTDSIAHAGSAPDTAEAALAPLHRTALTATDYWNDSCSIAELTAPALATTSPSSPATILPSAAFPA